MQRVTCLSEMHHSTCTCPMPFKYTLPYPTLPYLPTLHPTELRCPAPVQAEYNRQQRYEAATFMHPSLIPPSPFEPPYEPPPDPSIPIRVIPLQVGGTSAPYTPAAAPPALPQLPPPPVTPHLNPTTSHGSYYLCTHHLWYVACPLATFQVRVKAISKAWLTCMEL